MTSLIILFCIILIFILFPRPEGFIQGLFPKDSSNIREVDSCDIAAPPGVPLGWSQNGQHITPGPAVKFDPSGLPIFISNIAANDAMVKNFGSVASTTASVSTANRAGTNSQRPLARPGGTGAEASGSTNYRGSGNQPGAIRTSPVKASPMPLVIG